jgi:azurin
MSMVARGPHRSMMLAGALVMTVILVGCSGTLVPITPPPATSTPRPEPSEAPTPSPAPSESAAASPSGPPVLVEVTLTIATAAGAEDFAYLPTALEAPAGSTITLTLTNATNPDDEVGHNWVLVRAGQEASVLASALAAGDARDWLDTEDPGIIAATQLIEGGQQADVTFDAPPPGSYTFVCTFPKHYPSMQGSLTVP